MSSNLVKTTQNLILIFNCVFCFAFSQAAETDTWTRVTSNDSNADRRGANVLMAIIRNADDFKNWINGQELKKDTRILVKKSANPTKLNKDGSSVSKTRYVLVEQDDKLEPTRILIVEEQITTKGSETTYKYPSVSIENKNLESAPNQKYIKTLDALDAPNSPDCIEVEVKAKLCKVSKSSIQLVRAISRHAKVLAKKINDVKTQGYFALDYTAPKYISYEINQDQSKVRNVELSGFLRQVDEDFSSIAPDATSVYVVKFGTDTEAKIVQRKQDYNVKSFDDKNVEFITQ